MAMAQTTVQTKDTVQKEIAGRSLWSDARRRFMRNRAAVFSTIILIVITILCFGAPYVGLRSQSEINWDKISAPPSWWPAPAVTNTATPETTTQSSEEPAAPSQEIAQGSETYDLEAYKKLQEESNTPEESSSGSDETEDTASNGNEEAIAEPAAPADDRPYLFGTDRNGRDLFVRTLYGGQVSLSVALVATIVSLVIGVLWGASAGFMGGAVDSIMMRFVDILYSVPFIFFVIMLTVAFGRYIILIYVAIGAVSWLDMARIVRGQTISLKRKEFIEAAHASGVSAWRIITKHIIPNCLGPVVVYMMLTVPSVMLTESFVSYLGMGVQEPQSSWGTLIAEGAGSLEFAPWQVLFPGLTLAITLICLNFIGDGLRDALDPKDR